MKSLPLNKKAYTVALVGIGILSCVLSAEAEDTEGATHSSDDVARELTNPNSSLATLNLKNQYRWYTGDLPGAEDQGNYTMIFQPIFPLALPAKSNGDKANIFLRPGIPILFNQPVPKASGGGVDYDGTTALGDIQFDLAYGVSKASGFLWAAGVVGTLPTATDSGVAGKQLRLGPEMLLAKFEPWGLYGIFPSHQWDVTGWSDKTYSTTTLQPVLKFILKDGWTLGTSPIGFYDWESDEWTYPVNVDISKTVVLGKTPWKFDLEFNWYFVQPDEFGPEFMIGFNIAPVVRNPFQKPFNKMLGIK